MGARSDETDHLAERFRRKSEMYTLERRMVHQRFMRESKMMLVLQAPTTTRCWRKNSEI